VAKIPQGSALASTLTARENVLVPLLGTGIDIAEAHSRVDRALEDVGLHELAPTTRLSRLSPNERLLNGNQRRLNGNERRLNGNEVRRSGR
jgi:ABC-type lipoprotein export system ATPase subunit